MGIRTSTAQHCYRTLDKHPYTCEEIDAIEDLVFVDCIFEEVVAFEVLIIVCEDDTVFEIDGAGSDGLIEDDLVGRTREEEVKVDVVFTGQSSVY